MMFCKVGTKTPLTVPSFVAAGAAVSWRRRDCASKTMLSTSLLRTRGVGIILVVNARSLSMYNGAALGGAAMVLPVSVMVQPARAYCRREAGCTTASFPRLAERFAYGNR